MWIFRLLWEVCEHTLIPTAIMVSLIVSIYFLISAIKENKANPDAISKNSIIFRVVFLIVSLIAVVGAVIDFKLQFAIYLLPGVLIATWVISLCVFLSAKKKISVDATSIPESSFKARKIFFIVSSIITGLFVVIVISFITLFVIGIAYM